MLCSSLVSSVDTLLSGSLGKGSLLSLELDVINL